MELGLYTFADVGPEIDPARRLHNLLEEIELADQLGLDVFGVGEHHRPDYAVSSPAVALAAAAARTRDIRLTSAVTVLSSDDPVRVFQDFATLDLISDGRAEIMAGRGSFIESFPLFGYDLGDYDQLFSEKLELLLKVRDSERVTWAGKHRPPLEDAGVYPRPLQNPLPVWIAVGGTPQSVVRAALLGLPLAIAIIGGQPEHFATYAAMMNRIGRERGWSPMGRGQFEMGRSPRGALLVGSPDEVVQKILFEHELFGHQRFMAQISVGTMVHEKVMRAIELFGTEVAPAVRKEINRRSPSGAGGPAAI